MDINTQILITLIINLICMGYVFYGKNRNIRGILSIVQIVISIGLLVSVITN